MNSITNKEFLLSSTPCTNNIIRIVNSKRIWGNPSTQPLTENRIEGCVYPQTDIIPNLSERNYFFRRFRFTSIESSTTRLNVTLLSIS